MDPVPSVITHDDNDAEQDLKEKKKKKKKSTASLRKLQAKAAEEARHNLIKQRQENLRLTKARIQAEWEANHAKAENYVEEFSEREKALQESCQRLREMDEIWEEYKREQRKDKEWRAYLSCSGLPRTSSMPQINSYIFVWTELDTNDQMHHCIRKTAEVMELLEGLEDVIRHPAPDSRPFYVQDMKELRNEMRRLLHEHIDRATFYLLSRIETDMVPLNVSTSKYFTKCPFFQMCLWAELYTPIPSLRGKDIRHPLKVYFEEIDLTMTIPVSLLDLQKVIRAMWMKYDHWSDKCRSYECPSLPFYYFQTMHDLFISEFNTKREILEYREFLEKLTKKRIAALPPEPTLSQELLAWGTTPQRALSDEVMYQECEQEDNLGQQMRSILNVFEVNLRERTFLGDFLLLEILQQPPQAQCFRFKHCITLREEPPKLKIVEFYEVVKRPEVAESEDEQDGKKDDQKKKPEETKEEVFQEELKKLVSVQMQLCQTVIWFEKPQLANWDPVHGYWSMEDVYEVHVDDEEEVMMFKTGRLGLLGLHVSTYCHFPFQDWLFEPYEGGGVSLYLKTSKADLHFVIRECEVCLQGLDGVRSKAMNWILGKFYPLSELIQHLKKGGLDVFPAPDATAYINGVQSKHIVVEENAYQIWGVFSKTFRFKRSKFNQAAERAKLVFQAQEIYKGYQVDFCLLQTSMCSCYVLNINEDSKAYSTEIAPGMKPYVDLYTLLLKNSTGHARREASATSYLEIQTIKEFLSSIRPISFS